MITIIDRYISKLFLGYFLGGVTVFVTLFYVIDFMSNFSRYNAPTDVLFMFYLYRSPEVIYQMIPVGCLMATVFTLSHLNKNSELIALFSLGMSLARVSAPILVWVTIISAISFWSADRLMPYFGKKKAYVYYVEIKKKPGLYSLAKTEKIWYRSGNVLFNLQTLNPTRKLAQGVTLYYFDDFWNLVQMVSAKKANLENEHWNLTDGITTVFAQESPFPLTQTFKRKTIAMSEDIASLSLATAASSDLMDLKSLSKYIRKNKDAGLDTTRYEVDYHAKFGFAFAAFVMSILGIPFSISRVRSSGTVKNVGMCILVTFLYWSFYSSFLTLGKHGAVPPIIAAWAPNITMILTSIAMLIRLKR